MTNLMRAQNKAKALHSEEKPLLTRNSWMFVLAMVLASLLSTASAFAVPQPSVQIANANMFRPRGMVRATYHLPAGGEITDYWVSDGASGFCRIDQQPDPANPGFNQGILNLSTCYLPAVFEPQDYQAETRGVNGSNGYVFVAGINEVTRLEFTQSATQPGRTVINAATQVSIFTGTASIFSNGLAVGRNRAVQSPRMGPDGKLYICFQGSGDIWRIKNPLSPTFTPAGNAVERVGTSDNGKTLLSLGWIGNDLWMQQAGFLNRIQNATACNYFFPQCQAVLEFGKLQTQEGMATDQYISSIPNGRWLYWGNGNRVVRYDTQSAGIMEVWNQSGFVNGSAIPREYTLIMGLNFIQPQHPLPGDPAQDLFTLADGSQVADMTACMDKIIEAPLPAVAGILPKTGECYMLKSRANMVAEACVTTTQGTAVIPPPCVNSQIGNDAPPNASPTWNAARRAVLLLAGVTHPRGLLFLQSNWWVSDEALGFCKINIGAGGGAAMTNCFQPVPGFIPGQAAADAPAANGSQNVYVPDSGHLNGGIYRLTFAPDGTGGTVSQTGLLNSGPGTVSAIAIPNGPFNDGSIYFGYYDRNKIDKISSPATAPSAFISVGGVGNGVGALGLAFKGNDLYLAEMGPPANTAGQLVTGGQITYMVSASPSQQRGGAIPVGKPISRLQSATIPVPQTFINPGAILVSPDGDREACLPPLGVKLSSGIPADPTTAPALYYGSLGVNPADVANGLLQNPEVDQYGSICTTEGPWVQNAALDPLLALNVPLAAVTALGSTSYTNPAAQLAIGDDPATLIQAQTLQKSKILPPATTAIGQGHVYIVF